MRPRTVVAIVGVIVLVAVLLICGLMYTTDQNEASDIVTRYNQNTQKFDRIRVDTIIEEHQPPKMEDEDDYNYTPFDPSQITSWIDACIMAHHLMFHAGGTYSPTQTMTINGLEAHLDCSGYLGVACYLYGYKTDMSPVTNNWLDNSPFTNMGNLPLSELQAGDILVYDKHIEVFAGASGSNAQVYSWGSSDTAEFLYKNDVDGHDTTGCSVDVVTLSSAFADNPTPLVYRVEPPSTEQPEPTPPPNPPPAPEEPEEPEEEITPPGIPEVIPPAPSNWIDTVALCHRTWGHNGFKYVYGGNNALPNGDAVRTDCSGFVSYCCQVYGLIGKGAMYTSGGFPQCPGFENITAQCHSKADVQAGDIIGYQGHVEIYAGNDRVYNWGGHASAEDKYASCSHTLAECSIDCTSSWSRSWSTVKYVLRLK